MSCGSGIRSRGRACTGPAHGGLPCSGEDNQRESCTEPPCPGFKKVQILTNFFLSSEWAGWLQWSSCSQTCGLGRRGRTRVCSHSKSSTNSTEAISLVDPDSVAENPSEDSDKSSVEEALDNLVADFSGQEDEESEDILSDNSSGDIPSLTESVEGPLERRRKDGGLQDSWESCFGEMNQLEDCQETKCPGFWVGCKRLKCLMENLNLFFSS